MDNRFDFFSGSNDDMFNKLKDEIKDKNIAIFELEQEAGF